MLFDLEDQDAAYAELDARWEAGEGAAHRGAAWTTAFGRGFARRDWDTLTAQLAPSFEIEDHRMLGWGAHSGPAAWLARLQSLVDLAPDTRIHIHHARVSNAGMLWQVTTSGTREGGAFELPWIGVMEIDGLGRNRRVDLYDFDRLDAARARFDEVRAKERRDPRAAIAKPNAAVAAMERGVAAFDACVATGDWDAIRALHAPHETFEDRQRRSLLSGDRELSMASLRERGATGARPAFSPLGTVGDRIAVLRMLWSGGPLDARFDIEHLVVVEVDASGVFTATILFDLDDARDAQREAWARWAAIDPVAAPWVELWREVTDAWNARDRSRLRDRFADDMVVEDHRHAGLGRIEGADAYVDSNVVLWELAPDQRLELGWSWPAVDRHGFVVTLRRKGTLADGGAFESEYVWLGLASGSRITRGEFFEIDDLDAAPARLAELCAARITT